MTQDFVSTIGEFERETVISNALGALGENDQLRVETFETIRQWIAQQPTLARVQFDDYIILAYARGCKYSIKKIQQRLETTLTMRATIPEFFHDWDPSKPELQAALGEGSFLPLLNYDNLGRKVIIIRPGCYDPYLHKLEDIEKSNFMVSDIMGLEDEQLFITGLIIIIDLSGFSFSHLARRPLNVTKKWLHYLQNAAPLNPKKVHFIQTSASFHTGFNLMSRVGVLSDKLKERIKIHGSGFESLFQDIPREILPIDYGGDGLSLSGLTDYWKNRIENSTHLLRDLENFKADESQSKAWSFTGMLGWN